MFELQKGSNTSLLATSRPIPEIIDIFAPRRPVVIRATADDVRAYIEGNLDTLPKFVQNNVDLQEQIKVGITKAVDGMWVLVFIRSHRSNLKHDIFAMKSTLPTNSPMCNSFSMPP